ncbi:MAG TPA: DNA-directed RNA polymerase subunit omega [Pseudogracilibacillus sp.]|nr:DNA-directed RNA polymerase subunit omega [Pseudogracilibacillus sp.]
MLEPSIDSLLKQINSKYTIATIAARRARDLKEDASSVLEHPHSLQYVGVALEEIDEGKLTVKKTEET